MPVGWDVIEPLDGVVLEVAEVKVCWEGVLEECDEVEWWEEMVEVREMVDGGCCTCAKGFVGTR